MRLHISPLHSHCVSSFHCVQSFATSMPQDNRPGGHHCAAPSRRDESHRNHLQKRLAACLLSRTTSETPHWCYDSQRDPRGVTIDVRARRSEFAEVHSPFNPRAIRATAAECSTRASLSRSMRHASVFRNKPHRHRLVAAPHRPTPAAAAEHRPISQTPAATR